MTLAGCAMAKGAEDTEPTGAGAYKTQKKVKGRETVSQDKEGQSR